MKVKELLKLVEKDGWTLVRTKGSHRQFKHPSKPGTVTIAVKPSVDSPRERRTIYENKLASRAQVS